MLIKLRETVLLGWPQIKQKVGPSLREYLDFRDELSQMDGLLLKGERLIVPKSMHKEMLDKIHNVSHLGVQKCFRKAWEIAFWPGLNGQKRDKIASCKICNEFRNKQAKQPMKAHEIPERPWPILGSEFFGIIWTALFGISRLLFQVF